MDYLGIILGIISVMQGWRNNRQDSERLKKLKEVLKDFSSLDEVLIYSKKLHDEIEKHQHNSEDRAQALLKYEKNVYEVTNEHADAYINHVKRLEENLPSQPNEIIADDLSRLDELPVPIKNNIRKVYEIYPRLIKSMVDIEPKLTYLLKMQDNPERSIKDFARLVRNVESKLNDALRKADIVVYNSATTTSYLHHELSKVIV